MKLISVLSICLYLYMGTNIYAQSFKTDTLKVWGNCGMCKKTIEASLDLNGVKQANWNKNTKMLVVTYDTTKFNVDKINTLIADAGYDTEKTKANDKAYAKLSNCCQYKRKDQK